MRRAVNGLHGAGAAAKTELFQIPRLAKRPATSAGAKLHEAYGPRCGKRRPIAATLLAAQKMLRRILPRLQHAGGRRRSRRRCRGFAHFEAVTLSLMRNRERMLPVGGELNADRPTDEADRAMGCGAARVGAYCRKRRQSFAMEIRFNFLSWRDFLPLERFRSREARYACGPAPVTGLKALWTKVA